MNKHRNFLFRISHFSRKKIAKILGRRFPSYFEKKVKNPVFIIGCGRSGTTMLAEILARHKDICNYSEGNELWDPKGYRWYLSSLDRPPFWYDPIAYTKVWRDYFNDEYKKELKAIFGCFQVLSRKRVFVNKSPMNTFRITDILEIYPKAKFIHIIRDGRAVSYSWALRQYTMIKEHAAVYRQRGFFYSFNDLIKIIAKSWVEHINEVEKQKKILKLIDNDILLEFTYEDFCDQPKNYLGIICDYFSISQERLIYKNIDKIENKNYKWEKNIDDDIVADLNEITMPIMNRTRKTQNF